MGLKTLFVVALAISLSLPPELRPTGHFVRAQSIFQLRPSNPGLEGTKPYPRNYICPQLAFEPRSPKLSMRYGPFVFFNGETQTPADRDDTVEACGNTVALQDGGYIGAPSLDAHVAVDGPRYQITQIVDENVVNLYLDRALWVCWKAPETTRVEVTTARPNSRIVVYAGCGCAPERAPLIGCLDGRDPTASGVHYAKRLVFNTVGQHDYLVRVGVLPGADDEEIEFDIQKETQTS